MASLPNVVKLCVIGLVFYCGSEVSVSGAASGETASLPPVNILSHLDGLSVNFSHGSVMRCEHRPILKIITVHDCSLFPFRSELAIQGSDKISESTPPDGSITSDSDSMSDEKANDAGEQIGEDRAYHFIVPAFRGDSGLSRCVCQVAGRAHPDTAARAKPARASRHAIPLITRLLLPAGVKMRFFMAAVSGCALAGLIIDMTLDAKFCITPER